MSGQTIETIQRPRCRPALPTPLRFVPLALEQTQGPETRAAIFVLEAADITKHLTGFIVIYPSIRWGSEFGMTRRRFLGLCRHGYDTTSVRFAVLSRRGLRATIERRKRISAHREKPLSSRQRGFPHCADRDRRDRRQGSPDHRHNDRWQNRPICLSAN